MAAKNAAKPRPGKNSDGQTKRPQPTMTHSISIEPGKPTPPAPLPPPPGAPAPGTSNPMTHPAHPMIQSSLGTATPSSNPLDQIHPQPDQDQRQVRENIQYKDMNPAEQSQVATQQGLDPYAPLKMVQQGVTGALQQGASSSPVPNMLSGPYVPPGIESFPDDMAHLTTLMAQGFAPGASGQEHEFGLNAHAMAQAKIKQAMAQGQNGTGQPTPTPLAPAQPQAPGAAPPGVTYAPGIPEGQQGPTASPAPMSTSLGTPDASAPPAGGPAPVQPGAPGGIPPALIAALLAKHKQNQPVR